MLSGGAVAVSKDVDVTSKCAVRQIDDRIREHECQFWPQGTLGQDPQGGAAELWLSTHHGACEPTAAVGRRGDRELQARVSYHVGPWSSAYTKTGQEDGAHPRR